MDGVRLLTLALLFALNLPAAGSTVRDLKIKVLSTMLADGDGIGEWGFAAMVEVDGRRILFDTGWRAADGGVQRGRCIEGLIPTIDRDETRGRKYRD
jgi:hypothetical protein